MATRQFIQIQLAHGGSHGEKSVEKESLPQAPMDHPSSKAEESSISTDIVTPSSVGSVNEEGVLFGAGEILFTLLFIFPCALYLLKHQLYKRRLSLKRAS